jgi:hypothetical protein
MKNMMILNALPVLTLFVPAFHAEWSKRPVNINFAHSTYNLHLTHLLTVNFFLLSERQIFKNDATPKR